MNIKKIILSLSAVCVLSFGAAALLLHSVQGFADSGDNIVNVDKQVSGDLSQASRIEVLNKTAADIKIIVSETDKVSAHLYGTVSGNVDMKQPGLTIDKKGGVQAITASWEKDWQKRAWFNVHFRCNLKLDITVPATYTGAISIVTASGDVRSAGFHGKTIEIRTASGDVSLNDFSGKLCKISTASGDATVGNARAERMSVNTASGDIVLADSQLVEFRGRTASGGIRVRSVKADGFSSRSASGDISLSGLTGKALSAGSTSGELTVSDVTGEKLSFNTTSGDVRLRKIAGDLEAGSTSGDVKAEVLNFQHFIKVSTTSGDIQLKIAGKSPYGFQGQTHGDITVGAPGKGRVTAEKQLSINCDGCGRQVSAQSVSGDIEIN